LLSAISAWRSEALTPSGIVHCLMRYFAHHILSNMFDH
jgi:hypothetical protein